MRVEEAAEEKKHTKNEIKTEGKITGSLPTRVISPRSRRQSAGPSERLCACSGQAGGWRTGGREERLPRRCCDWSIRDIARSGDNQTRRLSFGAPSWNVFIV